MPDFDGDGATLPTDIDDANPDVNPFQTDGDADEINILVDPDDGDAGIPGSIPDLGLSTGSPYVIGLGDDLVLGFSTSVGAVTNTTSFVFDFGQDDTADAYARSAGTGPFAFTIDNADLVSFGIAGVGVHQFDVAAYGVGVAGVSAINGPLLSGTDNLGNSLVTQTVTFTVVPEPTTALLFGLGLVGLTLRSRRA
jgi:hypothetical protein